MICLQHEKSSCSWGPACVSWLHTRKALQRASLSLSSPQRGRDHVTPISLGNRKHTKESPGPGTMLEGWACGGPRYACCCSESNLQSTPSVRGLTSSQWIRLALNYPKGKERNVPPQPSRIASYQSLYTIWLPTHKNEGSKKNNNKNKNGPGQVAHLVRELSQYTKIVDLSPVRAHTSSSQWTHK